MEIVTLLATIRLVTHLNVLRHGAPATGPGTGVPSIDVAARTVQGQDAAHHVTSPDALLGLPPEHASTLEEAMEAALAYDSSDWVLALPRPGKLGPLRGPAELTRAALDAGAAVIPREGGPAWVPTRVGPAVQWVLVRADRPFPPVSAAEAEHALSLAIVAATSELDRLGMVSGRRPGTTGLLLPAAYPARQRHSADRALRLVEACEAGLADESGLLHAQAVDVRARTLRTLLNAALDSLEASCAWPPDDLDD
ncbi:hypothetical protein GA0111570_10811 [Raineyella antarctica]|uniref:Uncharacterized protein n=1 Tax=Raineyella antarctica TaxID=1577474 RepID=A0A1G6HC21_9ACTN|nr:hypothetical protein [Raineyella antarctica]SDB90986.1 hypothetical protein GA0111570_10811 [Raineyella antarctica]